MSTVISMPHVEAAPVGRPTSRSYLERHGVTVPDALIAALAFLFVIAFGPTMAYPSWTPRFALILIALPSGMLALVAAARARDRTTWLALAAIAWVLLFAVLGDAPRSALIGFAGRDLSALVFAGSVGLWALGRQLAPSGVAVFRVALLSGLVLSVLVGVLQLVFDVSSGVFAMNGGRPSGLTSNPVYLGGLMAAGVIVAAGEAAARKRLDWWHLSVVAVLAAGLSLSGSRVALVATIVLFGYATVRSGIRSIAAPAIAALVGIGLGMSLDRMFGRGQSALARTADSASLGLGSRVDVWGYGLEAFGDRWFKGWGFGRFQAAVQGKYSPEFVAASARNDVGQAWFDAHNVFIGSLVAVGAIGFFLLWGWVASAARRSAGPLAWGCAALFLTWMLQPPALPTLPIAALMLGAGAAGLGSAGPAVNAATPSVGRRRLGGAALALGILAGGGLVVADVNLYRATEALDPQRSEQAARWWPGDPVVASLVAQVWALDTGDATAPESIDWWRQAAERNPDRPYWWALLGVRHLLDGQLDEADASFGRALELQPTHYLTRQLEVRLAVELNDADRLRAAVRAACEVDAPECETDVEQLIAGF